MVASMHAFLSPEMVSRTYVRRRLEVSYAPKTARSWPAFAEFRRLWIELLGEHKRPPRQRIARSSTVIISSLSAAGFILIIYLRELVGSLDPSLGEVDEKGTNSE